MPLNFTFSRHLALGSLILLLACKKDAPEADSSNIRLFTNSTEVTDAAVKKQFLARHPAAFQTVAVSPSNKITFISADTARFSFSTIRFAVVKSGSQYLFYSPWLVQLSDDDMLLHNMLKYVGPKAFIPCANGNLTGCYVAQEVRVGIADAKQVTMSYLQYYRSVTQLYMGRQLTRQQQGTLFNELNEAITARVPQSDTLAVRVSSVSLPIQ